MHKFNAVRGKTHAEENKKRAHLWEPSSVQQETNKWGWCQKSFNIWRSLHVLAESNKACMESGLGFQR